MEDFLLKDLTKQLPTLLATKKQKKQYNKKGRWSKAEHKKIMKALQEDRSVKEM